MRLFCLFAAILALAACSSTPKTPTEQKRTQASVDSEMICSFRGTPTIHTSSWNQSAPELKIQFLKNIELNDGETRMGKVKQGEVLTLKPDTVYGRFGGEYNNGSDTFDVIAEIHYGMDRTSKMVLLRIYQSMSQAGSFGYDRDFNCQEAN